MPNTPIIREDGWVAVQHFNTNGATVMIEADKTVYSFSPQHGVSMAWVRPEHVAQILQVKARICCGRMGEKFHYASQIAVNLWTTGQR